MESKLILDEAAMNRAIARISYEILEKNKGAEHLLLMGVISRGVELAHRIAAKLLAVEGCPVPVGWLDITAYRDDKLPPENHADRSWFPCEIEGKTVVLVDDVIYTGRSARSAMEAVIHRGRPKRIQLAVLVDRGHRELPIRADFVGKILPTSASEQVVVQLEETDGVSQVLIQEG